MDTFHDEAQYIKRFETLVHALKRLLPRAIILFNQIPKEWAGRDLYKK